MRQTGSSADSNLLSQHYLHGHDGTHYSGEGEDWEFETGLGYISRASLKMNKKTQNACPVCSRPLVPSPEQRVYARACDAAFICV